jgi:UDP-glucose 4-epimerase
MRIAVTGGAGFIGSHTAERLVHAGHQVLVLDDLSQGSLVNLASFRSEIDFQVLDVRDRDGCARSLCEWQPDAVVHLAAVASVQRSITAPTYAHDVNVNGTFSMLEAARLAGVQRFVFASSAAVYGSQPSLPSTETDAVEPASPYAAHKAMGELLCSAYRTTWDLQTVALRFFNVYGPRQRPDNGYSGVISCFVRALRCDGRASIYGDGAQSRDFIYVSDVAQAVVVAATGKDPGAGPFNVARGDALSVRQLYSVLAQRLGIDDEPVFAAPRPGDVRHSRGCAERMRNALGVTAEVPFEAGLERLLAWFPQGQHAAPVAAAAG